MTVLRWRCPCGFINNTVDFEGARMVQCKCAYCNRTQVVENTHTKAQTVWYGARKIA